MKRYKIGLSLFFRKIYGTKMSMVKDIAGRDSLYLYSQLPFVETLTFPAFFEIFMIFFSKKGYRNNKFNFYFL